MLSQFEAVCRERGWDTVIEVAMLDGVPVYELSLSSFVPRGKIGYPPYFSLDGHGGVVELDMAGCSRVIRLIHRGKGTGDGRYVKREPVNA